MELEYWLLCRVLKIENGQGEAIIRTGQKDLTPVFGKIALNFLEVYIDHPNFNIIKIKILRRDPELGIFISWRASCACPQELIELCPGDRFWVDESCVISRPKVS